MHYKSLNLTSENFEYVISEIITLEDKPVIAVGVSGGADSIALTLLLKSYLDNVDGKLIALTVDHNIREESAEEAKQVHKLLSSLDIEHHILNYEGEIPKSNLMEEARKLRYKLLNDFCKNNNIINLAIAHHYDDQIENFFIRMDRGSGIEGLSSMPATSYVNGLRLIRPLLFFQKQDIYSFLKQKNIAWTEDPTNNNTTYKRNNIRKLLENINPLDKINTERVFRTAAHMSRANFTINNSVNIFLSKHSTLKDNNYITIDLDEYKKTDSEISLRVLSQLLQTFGCNIKPPRFEKLNNLHSAIRNQDTDFKKATLLGCVIVSNNNSLSIYRDHGLIDDNNFYFNKENNYSIHWDNRFLITLNNDSIRDRNCFVRKLNEDDRLQLKNIKVDFKGRNVDYLYSIPVIKTTIANSNGETLEKIIAVPHINYYTNDILLEDISVEFLPTKPLTKVVFEI